jgi:hypothetical protein
MEIEEGYVNTVREAEKAGYRVFGRVQVYRKPDVGNGRIHIVRYDFKEFAFEKGSTPYLMGGNVSYDLVVARQSGIANVTPVQEQKIPVGQYDRIDEYVVVDAMYKNEDGDYFYFKRIEDPNPPRLW